MRRLGNAVAPVGGVAWRRHRGERSTEDRAWEEAEAMSACLRVPVRYVDMLTLRSALQNLRTQRDRMGVLLQRPSQAELGEDFRRLSSPPPRGA